ncbi:MAG: hypothetical protein HY225_01590 [Candidatus Vogelbacteria bacterium]|nr:hypothetical protein [Candidatus Vogelbacteria bacterium]
MNSADLRERTQRIINEARTKTTKEDQAAADEITDKIPGLITEAITKKRNATTVMYLDEAPKPKRLVSMPHGMRAKSILRSNTFPFDDVMNNLFSTSITEYELTGVAEIVFNRCKDAGLKPCVAQTPDKTKWGIGIEWSK